MKNRNLVKAIKKSIKKVNSQSIMEYSVKHQRDKATKNIPFFLNRWREERRKEEPDWALIGFLKSMVALQIKSTRIYDGLKNKEVVHLK